MYTYTYMHTFKSVKINFLNSKYTNNFLEYLKIKIKIMSSV